MNSDKVSLLLEKVITLLISRHPDRTGLGIVLGLGLYGCAAAAHNLESNLLVIRFLLALPLYAWICFGVMVLQVPTIFRLLRGATTGNAEIDDMIAIIDQGNFSEVERRRLFRELIQKVSNKFLDTNAVKVKDVSSNNAE